MEQRMNQPRNAETSRERAQDVALKAIADALKGLAYGQVTVIVQDGVVVQIDRLERQRLR